MGRYFEIQTYKAEIGDYVKVKGKLKKVIGYAVGEDGRPCYALQSSVDEIGWRTYLVPCEDVTEKWELVRL